MHPKLAFPGTKAWVSGGVCLRHGWASVQVVPDLFSSALSLHSPCCPAQQKRRVGSATPSLVNVAQCWARVPPHLLHHAGFGGQRSTEEGRNNFWISWEGRSTIATVAVLDYCWGSCVDPLSIGNFFLIYFFASLRFSPSNCKLLTKNLH